MQNLESTHPAARGLKTTLLKDFINRAYQLPPFLHQIDIRELNINFREKIMLLTEAPAVPKEDTEAGEKEMLSMHEEDEEWLTHLRPVQFFKYHYKETPPHLDTLLTSFLQSIHLQTTKEDISKALNDIQAVLTRFCSTPGPASWRIDIQLPGSFCGEIFTDPSGIFVQGYFLRDGERRRLSWTKVEGGFRDFLSNLIE